MTRQAVLSLVFSLCLFLLPAQSADLVRIGAWNIEWLGKPGNRSNSGQGVPQSVEDISKYITEFKVYLLALIEVCDDDLDSTKISNTTMDVVIDKLNSGAQKGKYTLFPKKDSSDLDQHLGVAWNESVVTRDGEPFRLPVNTQHREYDLLKRLPYAVKFSFGSGKTDVVLVPMHMKSNRESVQRGKKQRAEEAKRTSLSRTIRHAIGNDLG